MVEEGQKLQHFYRVMDVPAVLIIDPVTGRRVGPAAVSGP